MKYIGTSKSPYCFKDHENLALRYWSQKSACMDSPGFTDWVHWWSEEVKKVSNGPWLLIMDNFSDRDSLPALHNVKYVFLPENTNATYQPLDEGIISKSKIKCHSKMLHETIDIVSRMQKVNHGFKSTSGNGRWGLQQGQLLQVAYAMRLIDSARDEITLPDISNCWIRSQCLPQEHVDRVNASRMIPKAPIWNLLLWVKQRGCNSQVDMNCFICRLFPVRL